MTTGRFFGFLLFAILMVAIGYGASYWYQYPLPKSTASGEQELYEPPAEQTEIQAQGRLEPESNTISVSALPGEKIVKINVHVGQDVKKEQELVILGSKEIRERQYELAVAQEEKANLQLASELALSQQRIAAAALAETQAKARKNEFPPEELKHLMGERLDLAKLQFGRLQQLRKNPATSDAITAAELDQQRLLIKQLEAEMLQNDKQTAAALATQQLGERAAALDSQIAKLAETGVRNADPAPVLKKTTELANLNRLASRVLAPSDGKILEIFARQGEHVTNTPILLMANLDQMICIAEVHEANLRDIETEEKDGKLVPSRSYPVIVKSAALADELKGEVVEVSRLIGAPKLRDPNPLARSDRRTAQVKIKLDQASSIRARRFVHLQVNVTIQLD